MPDHHPDDCGCPDCADALMDEYGCEGMGSTDEWDNPIDDWYDMATDTDFCPLCGASLIGEEFDLDCLCEACREAVDDSFEAVEDERDGVREGHIE